MTKKPKNDEYLALIAGSIAKKTPSPELRVDAFLAHGESMALKVLAGREGLTQKITVPRVQGLGLALAGFDENLSPGTVYGLGKAEIAYLQKRLNSEGSAFLNALFQLDSRCWLVSDGLACPSPVIDKANDAKVPILGSSLSGADTEARVLEILDEVLAPSISFHGDLVVFCGLGILILGKSGIGKSECALDLITHGHQLVADDIVHVHKNRLGQIIGRAKEPIRHHMDIRGLGIVNVKELFSIYSVMEQHAVDLIIFLEPWDRKKTYSCFQKEETLELLGVPKPLLRLPVGSGRNWENLIQVAVRNYILKSKGYDAERALTQKIDDLLMS